jgi:ornithine carbamoyltransferase
MPHVLSVFDLNRPQIEQIFDLAADLKSKLQQGVRPALLSHRVLGLLFEKPSLRTRVSFETAMAHVGGTSLFLGEDVGWGKREATCDFGQVLSQYLDVLVVRAISQTHVEELARYCRCPIINGLTDREHPCQALADLFTLRELRGELAGKKLAFVGDANNVARSLAIGCALLDVTMVLGAPREYQFAADFLDELQRKSPRARIEQTTDAVQAVQDADAIYTDVWASMGQESETAQRIAAFHDFQVNQDLMAHAPDQAIVLHCLPARRGEEITDEVLDGSQSAVIQQAGNRTDRLRGM